MNKQENNYVVMFADFSGSTRLYERFGDQRASQIIDQTISSMMEIINTNHGRVIKTIGDEIMCCFNHADNSVIAAENIQHTIDQQPSIDGFRTAVRIGLHWGSTLSSEDGDIFGDAVNVSARITSLSRARQIILTDTVFSKLNSSLKNKCRKLEQASVKGKSEPMSIYQLIWESNDVTMMQSHFEAISNPDKNINLHLQYKSQARHIPTEFSCLMLGRDKSCDLIIDIAEASRHHARIEHRRNQIVYIDQSTNGSFISIKNERGLYLCRDELALWGEGTISIGKSIQSDSDDLIYFSFNS